MTTDPLDRFERLFRALQLHPPEERAAFLDAACADDPALRRELESLLAAAEQADDEAFLAQPVTNRVLEDAVRDTSPSAEDDPAGQQVGPYTLVRLLGRGGMGDVFLARRDEPFRRHVALKIIRQGMDTRDVLARFSMERQILASLDHPNIARLLDGGMTDEGRPYFAMEYIEGRPITTYCDAHRLGLEDRLRLFQTVCRAVQYAHQNLVLHRDLKPSNILVTAEGTVKLLDFGIAKLLNPSLSPMALPVTRTAFRPMTPEYASPEQVRGEPLTTASDVYALGVMLYGLLCGHPPYRLTRGSTAEVARVVCEQDPERPSTRVGRPGRRTQPDGTEHPVSPAQVAETRGTSVDRLQRRLRGDLDNIVLMALRKEPTRRYVSAEQLADDIGRYLTGRPVAARPNTLGYRMRKYVRRHRAVVGGAAAAVLFLTAGLTVALWQAGEARRERDRAATALVQAEQALRQSEEVTDFLMGLFSASDPTEARGEETTARQLLERGLERAEELSGEPAVQAQMLDVVGRVYQQLGRYETAGDLLDRALALRRAHAGPDSPETARSLAHLADLARVAGDYVAAESLYTRALDLERRAFGPDHPLVVAHTAGLGRVVQDRGAFDRAEAIFRDVLTIRQTTLAPDDPEVLQTKGELARVLKAKGDFDEAEAVLTDILATRRKSYGDRHPEIAENLVELAGLYAWRKDFERSRVLHQEALEIYEAIYGPDHPTVAKSLAHVGNALAYQGRHADAQPLLRRALAIDRATLDPSHPNLGTALNSLALSLLQTNAYAEAETLLEEALEIYRTAFGAEHHYTAAVLGNLAAAAEGQRDYRRAESLHWQTLESRRATFGDVHAFVAATQRDVARFLHRRGRYAAAESLYTAAADTYAALADTAALAAVRTALAGLHADRTGATP